jgi:GNAT superfamily N-acetyltransferase
LFDVHFIHASNLHLVTIGSLLPTDLSAIPGLQPSGWGEVNSIHAFYTSHDFCFPLKVVSENRIAGIGTAIIHNEVAWLGHIIVHPDFRSRGIGRFITQALVDLVESKNCSTIYLIATDMGEPVYKKIGFETETEYVFFKDIVPNPDWGSSPNILPYSPAYKDQIAALDKLVSNEHRMFHLEQFVADGFVHLTNNTINGFYLPTFGDGLVLATKLSAGLDLLKLRLASKDNACFPIDNTDAMEFMHSNSFKEFRKASRMRLGEKRDWSPQYIYNRIGGNLG